MFYRIALLRMDPRRAGMEGGVGGDEKEMEIWTKMVVEENL